MGGQRAVKQTVGEYAAVDEKEALVVEHRSTMMTKDNIKSRILIEDIVTMETLKDTNLSFSVFTTINLTTFNMSVGRN